MSESQNQKLFLEKKKKRADSSNLEQGSFKVEK